MFWRPFVFALSLSVGQLATAGAAQASVDHHEASASAPRHVEVTGDIRSGYGLSIDGQPFEIKGVGLGQPSDERFEALVEAGGNSVRTWNARDADKVLALAKKHGVMVALGLDFAQELHGFDYDDEEAVAEQYAEVIAKVDQYKDHPNLLMWIIGNELNLNFYGEGEIILVNPKVYSALNDVTKYIHKVDPHHPVSTAFAGYLPEHIAHAIPHMPDLDILSIQLYGDLVRLPEFMGSDPSALPVMITEYGPLGHWEMPTTAWEREIEEPSWLKASGMAGRIERYLEGDTTGRIIGNFAFYWGFKQERTATWYSLITPEGHTDARTDELIRYWKGAYPENRAPLVARMTINEKVPQDNIILKAGEMYTAEIQVIDPEGEDVRTVWTLMEEVKAKSEGGEAEAEPEGAALTILAESDTLLVFNAPEEPGEYRLYATTYDPEDRVGTANVPVMVVCATCDTTSAPAAKESD
ncbi:MAG: hypothetical protein AAF830_01005 [Pseudomonadota bacterium]